MAFEVRAGTRTTSPPAPTRATAPRRARLPCRWRRPSLPTALGIDLVSFLEKNRVREGDVLEILKRLGEGRPGEAVTVGSCGLDKALSLGRESIAWGQQGARTRIPT